MANWADNTKKNVFLNMLGQSIGASTIFIFQSFSCLKNDIMCHIGENKMFL